MRCAGKYESFVLLKHEEDTGVNFTEQVKRERPWSDAQQRDLWIQVPWSGLYKGTFEFLFTRKILINSLLITITLR